MASYSHITISESHESRQVSKSSSESVCKQYFTLIGAKSIKDAELCICAHEPPDDINQFDFKKSKVNIDISPKFFDVKDTKNSVIEVSRTYTLKQGAVEYKLSMTTVTATETVATSAVAAPNSYPFWDPEDYAIGGPKEKYPVGAGSFINVKKQNGAFQIVGIDAVFPTYRLSVSYECSEEIYLQLKPLLLRNAGCVNSDDFLDWKAGELLLTSFDANRIADSIDIATGEPVINYQISYTFDVSRNEDYVAGDFIVPAEEKTGFSVCWNFAPSEEEFEMEDEKGEKIKMTRPKIEGGYASEIYPRVTFAKLIPSGVEI